MLYNINVKEDTVLPFNHKFVRKLMNAVQLNHRGPLYFIHEQDFEGYSTDMWLDTMRTTRDEFYSGMKLHRFSEDGYELLLLD